MDTNRIICWTKDYMLVDTNMIVGITSGLCNTSFISLTELGFMVLSCVKLSLDDTSYIWVKEY
jgi:hypothetical protein